MKTKQFIKFLRDLPNSGGQYKEGDIRELNHSTDRVEQNEYVSYCYGDRRYDYLLIGRDVELLFDDHSLESHSMEIAQVISSINQLQKEINDVIDLCNKNKIRLEFFTTGAMRGGDCTPRYSLHAYYNAKLI